MDTIINKVLNIIVMNVMMAFMLVKIIENVYKTLNMDKMAILNIVKLIDLIIITWLVIIVKNKLTLLQKTENNVKN